MDDLIVFSNSAEDHQKHLYRLLEVLSLEKMHFKLPIQPRCYLYWLLKFEFMWPQQVTMWINQVLLHTPVQPKNSYMQLYSPEL